uniref:EF-hand domain-containing protein n=1 Tax=Plectus sambesii TaxID=2011161 RepID=A0A914VBC0_9BILA
MQKMTIAHFCFAFACFISAVAAESLPYPSSQSYQGCNITRLANTPFGTKTVYYLVNEKYGKVQRPECSTFTSQEGCLALASHSQNAVPFVIDAYDATYAKLRIANTNGSYEANDNRSVALSVSNDYYNSYGNIIFQATLNDVCNEDCFQLRFEPSSGFCSLVFRYSSYVISAKEYESSEYGKMAQLTRSYSSSPPEPEQLWRLEPATDADTLFGQVDQNQDGEITFDECLKAGYPNLFSSLKSTFDKYDKNNNGFVTREEEKSYQKKLVADTKEQRRTSLEQFIEEFDANNDTKLQSDDIRTFLAVNYRLIARDSFATAFAKYDKNGDKGFDIDEFDNFIINMRNEVRDFMPLRTRSYY